MSHQHDHKGLEERMRGDPPKRRERKLHRDWRIWAAVILMLVCMVIYLLTMDEAIGPGGPSIGNPPGTKAPASP